MSSLLLWICDYVGPKVVWVRGYDTAIRPTADAALWKLPARHWGVERH